MTYNWKDKTILIAEDEEDNLELLCAILDETKANILKAVNGIEVIEYFIDRQKIDLILMDLKMSEMDGLIATKKLREMNIDIPIVAQTAYALSGDKEKALMAGCSAYIPKPIDSIKLLEIIAEFLDK